jgi:hypothetical protein
MTPSLQSDASVMDVTSFVSPLRRLPKCPQVFDVAKLCDKATRGERELLNRHEGPLRLTDVKDVAWDLGVSQLRFIA